MRGNEVVNICFHGVGTPGRELEDGEEPYWVGEDQFRRLLDEIAGWPVPVSISFDDGNASDRELALPALRDRGLTARFFALAGRVDRPGSLSAEDLRALRDAGMVIGSHGMSHRPWRGMDEQVGRSELVEARRVLADLTGEPVREAACPLGRYDRRLLSELRRLGYQRVYTSDRRVSREDAWLQHRFSVVGTDTPQSLRARALGRPGPLRRARLAAVGLAKRMR